MKITFNPSTVAALTTPPNNKDITFDLSGRNIFARGVKFYGTDTNTWRDIKINNVSIGSYTLDLRNGSNTTLTNTNGVVTINSTWRPVVDNLTSDSTTSSLSAKQGKVLKALIDGKSDSDHNHDGRYLKLTGGTMASNALITFADSGSQDTSKKPQGARGGLYWTGQSDYAKLYAEETIEDNLDLVIQFGDDNSNGLSIRNKANTQTSYISSSGVITTGTFNGNLDWSYITNKPSSYTPSAHTHAWNSLTHSSTIENQAILTNGKANGWKLQTLNIARWDNAANNAHSHANKSVLDGITSALVNSWNTAYNFVSNITGTDTDKVINKWEEIVNFLAGITEDNKLNTLLNSKLSIQQLSAKDILTTKTNNALFWVDTKDNASTITTGPFTDHPYALLSVTNYNQNAENHKFFYRSRLAFSSAGDIKVASCHHEQEYQQDETWYNVLTSKNSGINGSTIKLNGTSITVYSSGTADDRYVKKSGDTMQGVLTIDTTNFGALTIKRNDDANDASIQFRGKSSVYGYIGLNNSTKDKQFLRWSSDISRIYTILDTSSTYISNGKGVINGTTITQVDNATNSTNSTNARKLVNWYSARPTSLNAQFGDGSLRIFYATSSTTEGKPAEDSHILHLAWDNTDGYDAQLAVHAHSGKVSTRAQNGGTWKPWKTLAFTTDIPSSLKNPYSFNVFGVVYDGSAAKTVTTSTFASQLPEGTGIVTDGTMFITSWASDSGFADTNAVNVPYKRQAIHLWEYIKAKTDSLYVTEGHNHDGRYLRLNGEDIMQGNLYLHSIGTSYIGKGLGDKSGADFTEANIVIKSWWGISFKSYDDIVRTYIDTRTGNIGTKGVLNAVGAVIQGRVYNDGDDEGIIINPAPNGCAGLILGTHNGERSVFYLKKGNPFWRYNNGSTNLDIQHPKKPGVIALTSDIPSKDSWNYDDRYLRLTGGWMSGDINFRGDNKIYWERNTNYASISFKNDGDEDANDTIQFKTNTAARLYHNSYPILTTQNTYVSNNKGYINGLEITQVNNSDTVDNEHASNFSYTHQTSFDFSKSKSGRIVTFDQSNTDYGWINGFASTYNNYLTSVIFNTHRTTNWYVGYMEGDMSTGETKGLQSVHKLAFTTDIPSSLKNPYSFNVFGVVYDGSAAKTVTTSTFASQLPEGTGIVTDGTMFITSWASDSGFADTNAVNVPYKRQAIHLWEYIKAKTDSLYVTEGHNHDGRYLRLNGEDIMQGNLYLHSIGTSYIGKGLGDKSGADFTEANIVIKSWWGISFKSYDDIVRTYIDTRTGNIGTKGVLNAVGAVIQGRVYNDGDDEGIIINPAPNGCAGLILGTHNGERSVFYLKKGNPFWRYNNGSTNLDIQHPKKPGVIALTSDIPSKDSWNYDDRYLRLTGGWMSGDINFRGDNKIYWERNTNYASISFKNDGDEDANDTIQFKTNTAARLYHNSYPILTTQNTYVSNNKGYINGLEITQVNNSDTVDNEHASNFSYTHQTSFDFSKSKSGRIVTFDQSNTDYGWINGFASTYNNYLTSVIFNTHRTTNWYVGYMEGDMSTGETKGLQSVHKLAFADGDANYPIFLGYLNLYNGSDGTISGSFSCLGYSVPFTYTRGGSYCRIDIPDTSSQIFYIKAALASVHYSGTGMDNWVGYNRGEGAWWLHCYAVGSNTVQVKGFHLANGHNDSWWGGNPLYSGNAAARIITVCLFGYVRFR